MKNKVFKAFSLILACSLMFSCAAVGKTPKLEEGQRVVAIGDVHGDYQQFVTVMQNADLINKKNKWIAGNTQFVQLGDIPDRGPDTRKAMDLLMKLEKSAKKKGGAVHALIGNHEAMNMTNDLRYVHPGEYAAFADRKSPARQDAYYQQTIDYLKSSLPPEELPLFDKAHRESWNVKFPLGYVEHRLAWAATGKYGKWVLSHDAVKVIGDSLFLHGGMSPTYSGKTLSYLNTRIRTELADPASINPNSVSESSEGPLWYRGWADLPETKENFIVLNRILARYGVKRMVIAHTPKLPVILPRFDGKVILVDVGMSQAYSHALASLEIEGKNITAIIGEQRLPLPGKSSEVNDYLQQAEVLLEDANRAKVNRFRRASQVDEVQLSPAENNEQAIKQ